MERCKVVVWLAGVWIIWDIVRGWGLGTCYRPLLRPVGVRSLPFVSFLWIGLDLGSGIGKWKWKLQKSVFSRRRIFVDMDFWYTGFLVLCYLSFFPCLAIAIYFIFQILLTLWQVVLPWYIKNKTWRREGQPCGTNQTACFRSLLFNHSLAYMKNPNIQLDWSIY
jgi:hypothetical protein